MAIAAWLVGFATLVVSTGGVPIAIPMVLLCCVTALAAVSLGNGSLVRLFVDFVPLAAVLIAWTYLRGISDTMGMATHWRFADRMDRRMFGVQPTVWLQEHLIYSTPRWWDVPVTLCYMTFFVLPWILAAVFWRRSRRVFYRWTLRWVAMSFIAFVAFALAPTAPPWAAAECTPAQVRDHPSAPACMRQYPAHPQRTILGANEHPHPGVSRTVRRTSLAGMKELHMGVAVTTFQQGESATDLVASVPSLHAAGSLLISLFLWPRVRRRWRPLLAIYPPAMGFALVYTANHFVFDVLTGWVLAVAVSLAARLVEQRLDRRRRVRGDGPAVAADAAAEQLPVPA